MGTMKTRQTNQLARQLAGNRRTRPTIKDVGRAAHVSQATASYVLNNSKAAQHISKQTQKRVRAAAERLGYKFDPAGLRNQGLHFPHHEPPARAIAAD